MNDYMTLIAVISKLGDIAELPTAKIRQALDQYIARLETEVCQIDEETERQCRIDDMFENVPV
jgi:hypothetical protein